MARWLINGSKLIRRRRAREGNVAIVTTLMLTVMLGFVALSFDIGNVYRVRTESQSAVDSSALAGAAWLDGTTAGITAAKGKAVTFANLHYAYKGKVAITTGDVQEGIWDLENNTFSPGGAAAQVNALKVTHNVASVSLPFASALGKSSTPVKTVAIAIGGGPVSDSCDFPLILPDCVVATPAQDDTCAMCLKMANANSDNMAWTSFGNSNGLPAIGDAIEDACFVNGEPNIDANGECAGPCPNKSDVGDELKVNNGNIFNSNSQGPCSLIAELINRDGTNDRKPFTIKVPVIKTGVNPNNCGSAKLSGNKNEIAGYTLLDIYGVSCGQGANAIQAVAPMPYQPPCGAPGGKFLFASLHREQNNGSWTCGKEPEHEHAGGGFFGVSGEPRLVQ